MRGVGNEKDLKAVFEGASDAPISIADACWWLVAEKNITEEAATGLIWDAVEKGELGINSACEIYPLFKSEDRGYEESLEI